MTHIVRERDVFPFARIKISINHHRRTEPEQRFNKTI